MKITKQQLRKIIKEELLKEEKKHEPYFVRDLKALVNDISDDYRVQITYHGEPLEISESYNMKEDKVVYIEVL